MATGVYALEIPDLTVQSDTAASYSIPANYYGIVRGQVKRGGTLSIDSTVVLSSEDHSWNALNMVGGASLNASGGLNMATAAGAAAITTQSFGNSTARMYSSAGGGPFKVKSGQVIVGSGDARYHIELYRMPGT